MRQRVNLARALAIDPQILLMDEPFSSLDAQTREIMQTELMRIWDAGRKTVLFVTHQIDEAVFLSDRVLVFARRLSILGATLGSRETLAAVLRLAGEGKLRPVVDRVLPLEECRRAHELLEAGDVFGKIVLRVG